MVDADQEQQFSDGPLGADDRRNHRIMWWERTERRRRLKRYAKWLAIGIASTPAWPYVQAFLHKVTMR